LAEKALDAKFNIKLTPTFLRRTKAAGSSAGLAISLLKRILRQPERAPFDGLPTRKTFLLPPTREDSAGPGSTNAFPISRNGYELRWGQSQLRGDNLPHIGRTHEFDS
jgi:hypothetical protein